MNSLSEDQLMDNSTLNIFNHRKQRGSQIANKSLSNHSAAKNRKGLKI